MKTITFYKGLLFLLQCHLQALRQFLDDSRQCLLTAVLQNCVVLNFFMGLEYSFPDRICQIRMILTLIFWLNSHFMFISVGMTALGTQAGALV